MLDGGHDVADKTILDRVPRTFEIMPQAFQLADSSYLIDNSIDARVILKKENGKTTRYPPYPDIILRPLEKILSTSK